MQFKQTDHPQVLIIEPQIFRDERGFFMETYRSKFFSNGGIPFEFVQENHSSSKKGVLRGLHYQLGRPQGKLVRVVSGEVFDVAVDLRRSSPRFGAWVAARLSAKNHLQMWIPPGFAHGFYVLSQSADLLYKTTDYYFPEGDRCIRWDDPSLAVDWPVPPGSRPVLSPKDESGAWLAQAEVYS